MIKFAAVFKEYSNENKFTKLVFLKYTLQKYLLKIELIEGNEWFRFLYR